VVTMIDEQDQLGVSVNRRPRTHAPRGWPATG
jgi:hypothetical protein